jgi:hypothetical protein
MKKFSGVCFLFCFLSVAFLCGCHPRPTEDLVLADVALRAAQKVKADALAPDLYRKAENFFLRAKKDYGEGYYDSCRKFSNQARMLAEQAEFSALKKQSQLKDKAVDDEGSGAATTTLPPPPSPDNPSDAGAPPPPPPSPDSAPSP